MKILAIETSCDETAAALLETKGGYFNLLSNIVSSQVKIHARYGGIVPEVAARKQMEMILPVIQEAQKHKNIIPELRITNYELPDYIAVTNGPGLVTSLRVGVETARTLSYVWRKPLIAVNHLEGHIYASAISNFPASRQGGQLPISKKIPISRSQISNKIVNSKSPITNHFSIPKWQFPVLALIVSGGHTQLVLMRDYLKYKIVGETLDDAAGEAFDKVAKILEIGYPGGPVISKMALNGDSEAFNLPRPMLKSGDFNFSFSGLKTAVLYLVNDLQRRGAFNTPRHAREDGRMQYAPTVANICASFQQAVVDVLIYKTIHAAKKYKAKTIILGGGVAANSQLREQLGEAIKKYSPITNYQLPITSFSGDNAAMIAVAAYFRIKHKCLTPWQKIKTEANLRLK